MKVTSDDEIRFHSQIEIPAGIRIDCAATEDGHYVLSFGGWLLDDPRLVLDLQPGTLDQLLAAVQGAQL
jgi:hypothetical protein